MNHLYISTPGSWPETRRESLRPLWRKHFRNFKALFFCEQFCFFPDYSLIKCLPRVCTECLENPISKTEKKKREREKQRRKRRKEERKDRREKGKSHKMCLSDLLLPRAYQLIDPAAEFWVDTKTMPPITAFSQRVSMSRVPVECGMPLMWTVARELPTDLAETLLELQCHVRFYLSKFSSSLLHRCQTCIMV